MTQPRTGAHAKVDRADELVREFDRRWSEWVLQQGIVGVGWGPAEDPRAVVVTELARPPLSLGVVVGDAVHNLRSALDVAVWQIADLAVLADHGRLQFPIKSTHGEYRRWAERHELSHRLPEVDQVLRRLQPFESRTYSPPERHPLARLERLSNDDKHRVPLVAVTGLSDSEVSAGGTVVYRREEPLPEMLRVGDVLGRVKFEPDPRHAINLICTLSPVIEVLGTVYEVSGLLAEMARHVRHVALRQLEPWLLPTHRRSAAHGFSD